MLMPSIFRTNSLIDDLFDDDWFDDKEFKNVEKKLYGHRAKNVMNTDVKETEDGYELEMDLPGFKKDEIKASLENGYLTITAEKGLEKDQKEEEGKKYICRERYSGSCQRTFYVGDEIEQDDIKASFKHGILRLDIPKKQPKPQVEEKKCISIEG